MKKFSLIIAESALAVALLGTCGAATARAQDRRIVADVPFDFIVQDMVMPAGSYVITQRPEGVLSIASDDGRYFSFVLSTASDTPTVRPELVFDRIEGRFYFAGFALPDGEAREVVIPGASIERQREKVAVVLSETSIS